MIIICPHCGGEMEIEDKQVGERALHPRCGHWSLIGRHTDGSRYGVKVQPPPKLPFRKEQP